jgi:CheY-like chemotaxis protein
MRILIVDDYPGLIELYDLALAARGFHVVGAANASQALTLAAGQDFDAVVVDLHLPDGNGHDLSLRLRGMPKLARRPFVAISSFARDVKHHGFDAFLAKPVHPKRLASLLRRLTAC